MSIPLDRLYHYIESIARDIRKNDVLIYRFFPHGSKKQEDLKPIDPHTSDEEMLLPQIICYDQEPLDFKRYESPRGTLPENILRQLSGLQSDRSNELYKIYSQLNFDRHNLRYYPRNIYDHAILLHSELNSKNVKDYSEHNFIPVYHWAHAIIARDWFRYAEHITQTKSVRKTFLIYNRAWSGTREYRLKFSELLLRMGLENNCQMTISPIEPELGTHYDLHTFDNPLWRPNHVLENFFPVNHAESHYSADFELNDYESTDIEVVLETLFDDERWHLTEKILRPIALGQPFILVGTPLSLDYLRNYGFKTFRHVWDERYDDEINAEYRLIKVTDLMKNIARWDPETRYNKMSQAQKIADYNKKHFFSKEFQDLIKNELTKNLSKALNDIESLNTGTVFMERRKQTLLSQDYRQYSIRHKKDNQLLRQRFASWLKLVRKYKRRTLTHKL